MKCPVCNYKETKVIDSRVASDEITIRRRRECLKCGFRFSTYEQVELLDLMVLKRDGRKESYLREKLEQGLRRAFEKRAIAEEDFKVLINRIERNIQALKKNEIKSQEIGEIIMKELKKEDPVAYIRFASVYRAFEDIDTFQKEIKAVFKKKGEKPRRPRVKSAKRKRSQKQKR
ncbi:MAG: transcriptional regulator NrdR [Candidatus Parcubacteria bacterium]|nr:transcriptional regulator NrdR [Candidatus Parcubacteria bacterium]